jgi:type IV pilus biogenesis protein CpaD/CtpE
MIRLCPSFLVASLLVLAGCGVQTMTPDYAINVAPQTPGSSYVAQPPACPSFVNVQANPFDSQPDPQFGCATARNLALMVEKPEDLLQGRDIGLASGITTAGAVVRYNNDQTRGLIYLAPSPDNSVDVTSHSTASSGLSGETPPASPSGSGK